MSSPNVADVLREALCRSFHFQEGLLWHHDWGAFLKYLLKAALGGAIAAVPQQKNLCAQMVAFLFRKVFNTLWLWFNHVQQ